jgi:hypothetical protein
VLTIESDDLLQRLELQCLDTPLICEGIKMNIRRQRSLLDSWKPATPDCDRREVALVAVKPANREIHDLRQLIANLHLVAPTSGKQGIWTVSCVEDRIACAEQGPMHMIYLADRIANRYDNKIGC